MMTEEEVLKIFADTGALLTGHFELRSKLHSDRYFQCANVLRYPRIAARLCDALVAKMKAACDIGPPWAASSWGTRSPARSTRSAFSRRRCRERAWTRPASPSRSSRCAVSP